MPGAQAAAGCARAPRRTSCGTAAGSPAGCPGRSARDAAEPRLGHRARGDVRLAREQPQGEAVGRAHRKLAEHGRAPDARDAVPAVAGQQRDRVDDRHALHALGQALGEGEPDRAPVVHEQRDALDLQLVQEALDEGVVLGDRVAQRGRLARAPEAGQVGRHAAAQLEEGQPFVGAAGHAVQVQRNGAASRAGRAAPEDR